MTKDFTMCVFHADDWLLRSSESLACAAPEERARVLAVNKHLIRLRRDNHLSRSTLNKQEEHQLTQQRDDPPVKGKVHPPALLITSLEKHNCDAACERHPAEASTVCHIRRCSVALDFIVLLKLAVTMFMLAKRFIQWLLLVCIVQGCVWTPQKPDTSAEMSVLSWAGNEQRFERGSEKLVLVAQSWNQKVLRGRPLDALCQTAETSHYSAPKPTMAVTTPDLCQITSSRRTSANTLCATIQLWGARAGECN